MQKESDLYLGAVQEAKTMRHILKVLVKPLGPESLIHSSKGWGIEVRQMWV